MTGAPATGGGGTRMRCVVKQALLPKGSAYVKPSSEGALPNTIRAWWVRPSSTRGIAAASIATPSSEAVRTPRPRDFVFGPGPGDARVDAERVTVPSKRAANVAAGSIPRRLPSRGRGVSLARVHRRRSAEYSTSATVADGPSFQSLRSTMHGAMAMFTYEHRHRDLGD